MNLNPMAWLRATQNGKQRGGAHMTFAKTSVGRTITRTGVFLRKQIWIWPIIAVVLLTAVGLGLRHAIVTTMKDGLRSELQTRLDIETAMLETWFHIQRSNAESLANAVDVRHVIYEMLNDAVPAPGAEAKDKKPMDQLLAQLDKTLAPALSAHDYTRYLVVDKSKRIIAATSRELIGKQDVPEFDSFISRALAGETCVSTPFPSVVPLKDESGRVRTGVPTMFVVAPIRDESFQVVGVLGLRIRPELEFTRILQLGRVGRSGETYAFDKNGLFVSNSRFDDGLILLGLLPDQDNSHSILQLMARDPGGDMTQGHRSTARRRDLPLTRMAADAIAGNAGVDVDGYRDYRGAKAVGAWKWLPEANMGVATEIEYAEAFRPLVILEWTFWGLFILLALSSIAIFVFTILLARSRREAQKATIEAQQIGQYKLEHKLGAGGMGVVYKGQHAMLRRPTAIKMLDVDKVNEGSIQRFEREVQITSQLNNPHTVAIYDFGHTPEGVFYYAMEYLDGIDLQTLVERYGPQPVPRVIHMLLQVCSSLYEAHSLGLVHRDIKPANIMLNRRGGEPDVVKVLDFGLVKAVDDQQQKGMTHQASLTGTPLYMSPEAIQLPSSVDGRSDLYAVGAMGYFLLTGKPVFEADSIVDLCQKHVATPPVPPSEHVQMPIPPELESAILACLEKSRAKRPQTARDLAALISRCAEATAWSIEDSDAWWGRHERGVATGIVSAPAAAPPARTATHRHDMTIDQ
jgi:eukaryotic-like serine/threonine-protein kinase